MNTEKTQSFFEISLIVVLYVLASMVYSFICWLSIHGIFSASRAQDFPFGWCLMVSFCTMVTGYYLFRENRIAELVLYSFILAFLILLTILIIYQPYTLDSDLVDPHRSTLVYKVNHWLKYSGQIALSFIAIFASLKPKKITVIKIFLVLFPFTLVIAAWFLLSRHIPMFMG